MSDDPLDRLFERMREETAPPDLEADLLAAMRDPTRAARYRLEDLGHTARRGLVPGLIALAASVALAVALSFTGARAEPASTVVDPWRDVLVLDALDPSEAMWPLGRS